VKDVFSYITLSGSPFMLFYHWNLFFFFIYSCI